jgi:hypothetical protein
MHQYLSKFSSRKTTKHLHLKSLAVGVSLGLFSASVQAENIDVLLVYDTTAQAWAANNGGIELFSLDVQNRLNQVASNSNLDLTFTVVHSLASNYTSQTTTSSTSLSNDLTALRTGANELSEVNAVRDQYGADVVAMMIDHGSAYGYVGLGYNLIYWQGDSTSAFTVSAIRAVDLSNTLVHEIGHNLGAQHPKALAGSPGPNPFLDNEYSAGWFFEGANGTKYHTVMGYNYNNGNYYSPAPLFSSPLLTYQGSAAGSITDADNVRLINQTKAVIANYREATNPECEGEATSAWSSSTGELADYESSCDIPEGWVAGIPPDSDGDGMDDAYELRNGFNPNLANGNEDPDGDALTNTQEYALGTDPNNADSDGDSTPDNVDSNPLDANYRGSDLLTAEISSTWSSFNLPTSYTHPVVIAGPPSFKGTAPGVVRIRNVSPTGFDAKFELTFQEWEYLDGNHSSETIPHMVFEAGRHTMDDGSIWEVGTLDISGERKFVSHSFDDSFPSKPKLFLTLQSSNEDQAVSVRAKSVTVSGFSAAMYEEEGQRNGHAAETLGYLAIYSPTGSGKANLGGKKVPYSLASIQADHRWVPIFSSKIKVEEETSKDTETGHLLETLDVASIAGDVYAQDVSTLGGDTVSIRQQPIANESPIEWGYLPTVKDEWVTVPFSHPYTQPAVTASINNLSSELGLIQIRNVTSDSFDVRVAGWDYQGGNHENAEQVFYMVAESGKYSIGGLMVEAGVTQVSTTVSQSTGVNFTNAFESVPALFTNMNSISDDAAVTRVLSLTNGGFQVGLQEQENKNDGHGAETVGWIAIEKGSTTYDGRQIQVGSKYGSNNVFTFDAKAASRIPVVISSLSSFRGTDTAWSGTHSLIQTQVTTKVYEEQSRDDETGHTQETMSVIKID